MHGTQPLFPLLLRTRKLPLSIGAHISRGKEKKTSSETQYWTQQSTPRVFCVLVFGHIGRSPFLNFWWSKEKSRWERRSSLLRGGNEEREAFFAFLIRGQRSKRSHLSFLRDRCSGSRDWL